MKILILGDGIVDYYQFCHATRLCPEAPCPVLVCDKEYATAGGAGLVDAQLVELQANCIYVPGSHSRKFRVFAGSHLICRIDDDAKTSTLPEDMSLLDWADAIVVSDYGKGAVTPALAEKIIKTDKPVFVDAKNHWRWYAWPTVTVFPNEHEVIGCVDDYKRIVWKRGAKGCEMWSVNILDKIAIPATVSEVVDVTGAGDTFMASFVWGWTLQLPPEDCLRLANALAGEACKHLGTYVVPRQFAQAELDRLRASRESAQPSLGNSPDSTMSALLQQQSPYPWNASISEIENSPVPDCTGVRVNQEVIRDSLRHAQTLPELPSVPIVPTDAPLPSDQESSDEQDRRLR